MTITYHSPKNHEGLKKELKYSSKCSVSMRERERERNNKNLGKGKIEGNVTLKLCLIRKKKLFYMDS